MDREEIIQMITVITTVGIQADLMYIMMDIERISITIEVTGIEEKETREGVMNSNNIAKEIEIKDVKMVLFCCLAK